MKSALLISIITVVYNGEKYLTQTLESVIGQTYSNIEYIIVDGGSTDGTLDIIKKYESKISHWVSEPDKGLYDAMNKGINLANGELIGMINSDDWYEPDAVQTMVTAYLADPGKTIFHADRYDILEDGTKKIRKYNSSVFKFRFYGMTFNHPSMFIAQSEYDKHNYNPSLKSLSDYQFMLEAHLENPENLSYVNKAIVNYRLDGISSKRRFIEGSIEGFNARKNAGLSLIACIGAFLYGSSITLFFGLKGIFK